MNDLDKYRIKCVHCGILMAVAETYYMTPEV